jgi:integrase
MSKLSVKKIKVLEKPGRYCDGDGLYLIVRPSLKEEATQMNKSWLYRWGKGGANYIGLGSFKDVGLIEAREKRNEVKKQIKAGLDPKNRAMSIRGKCSLKNSDPTFREVSIEVLENREGSWKNAKYAKQWWSNFERLVFPTIGPLPISGIDRDHIIKIMKPIWFSRPETADRVLNQVRQVFDFAKAKRYIGHQNYVLNIDELKILLPKRRKRAVKHHPAMPREEVPALFTKLWLDESESAQALSLCILTAARTNEIIKANWSEIDFVNKVWRIPAARMKGGVEHRIPLSPHALLLLQERHLRSSSGWIFPSPEDNSKPLSNMAMLTYMKRREESRKYTVHGFRSTLRDWACEEYGRFYDHKMIEYSLAHSERNKTVAAYQRGDYFKARKILLNQWDMYVTSTLRSNVVIVDTKGGELESNEELSSNSFQHLIDDSCGMSIITAHERMEKILLSAVTEYEGMFS